MGEAGAPVIAAWSGYRSFRVDQKIIEDANRSISSFYLVPEDGQPLPAYLPGQFLTFRLDVPTATGRVEQLIRCYSLSDAPCPEGYRISVKRIVAFPPNSEIPGRASNYFHDHVVVGSPLSVRAPSGHFYLDGSDSPVVLIGGGIGITPMLSMLNWCLVNQPNREVWLFYGVRNSREMVMGPTLEALALEHKNFHFRVCFSAPLPKDLSGSDYHLQDRVDIGLLQTQLPSMSYQFYVCGPAPMMESLVPGLDAWGIPAESIHFEAFGPASIKLGTSKSTTSTDQNKVAVKTDIVVTFSSSGKTLQWQPITNSLLEFAESNGISVNSGCRAGSCGSCQTKILSGEVAYQLPPDYDPEPGYCLFCVCTPLTNLVVEA
ncbi:MAG: 2Fe-2S iron-sulfur cluster-binding protein [Methylococcales bacterium]|nr:2Fe-2S iron-sulfur cluster-binding protein [Methylococcales bacterium]